MKKFILVLMVLCFLSGCNPVQNPLKFDFSQYEDQDFKNKQLRIWSAIGVWTKKGYQCLDTTESRVSVCDKELIKKIKQIQREWGEEKKKEYAPLISSFEDCSK